MASPSALALAKEIARALDEKKAEGIVILDTSALHSMIECFVIATARGPKHAGILGDEANQLVKQHGSKARHTEKAADWVCCDFFDVVLHVFTPEARDYYDLEHLWADAEKVDWTPAGAASA